MYVSKTTTTTTTTTTKPKGQRPQIGACLLESSRCLESYEVLFSSCLNCYVSSIVERRTLNAETEGCGFKTRIFCTFYFAQTLVYLSKYVPDITWLSSFSVRGHVENFCPKQDGLQCRRTRKIFWTIKRKLNAMLHDISMNTTTLNVKVFVKRIWTMSLCSITVKRLNKDKRRENAFRAVWCSSVAVNVKCASHSHHTHTKKQSMMTVKGSLQPFHSIVIHFCPIVYRWVISKFNGTPTPKGSYSAKTGVNCTMSLSRVY